MADGSINPVRNPAPTLKRRRILERFNSSIGRTGLRQPQAAYQRSHRRCRMVFTPSQRRFGLLLLVGLAAVAMLLLSGGRSVGSREPPPCIGLAEPSAVQPR